jgi:hypothetical protein
MPSYRTSYFRFILKEFLHEADLGTALYSMWKNFRFYNNNYE